jgi:spore coat protein E
MLMKGRDIMATYSEIVTKAVIGKGKKNNVTIHQLIIENKVSKVLGCWIINNQFECVNCENHVEVRGSFELHTWYGYDHDTKSDLIKKEIKYIEEIPLKFKNNEMLTPNVEIKGFCSKYPTCIALQLTKDGNIEASVEKEYVVDIIGETKLRVQISQGIDDDWVIDEEIDNSVNVDYIKDKKD